MEHEDVIAHEMLSKMIAGEYEPPEKKGERLGEPLQRQDLELRVESIKLE